MTTRHTTRLALAAFALVALAACGKKDEVKTDTAAVAIAPPPPPAPSVSTIETGKHVAANRRVAAVDSVFSPRDTLYVAVVTANSTPTSSLTAKWTFETGQLVDSTTQAVAATDAANPVSVTEFHIVKPKGWPVGKYKVELWLDGTSAGTREVVVKK